MAGFFNKRFKHTPGVIDIIPKGFFTSQSSWLLYIREGELALSKQMLFFLPINREG